MATSHSAVIHSTSHRPSPLGLVITGFGEIVSRGRLIRYLVQADLKKKGTDTLLGNVWWVLDPLLQMLVYVIFVSVIFRRPQPDYPLFIFAAILPWKWFTSSVSDGINSVVSQERLIKQIQFPKIVLPVAAAVAGIVNFAFGMIPLAALLLLVYPDRLDRNLILVPVIAAVQFVFTLSLTIVLGAITVFVRDVGNIAGHVLRLWFYLSPGLYSIDQLRSSATLKEVPIVLRLLEVNPIAILFEAYRAVIYGAPQGGSASPDWAALGLVLVVSFGLLTVAVAVFKRLEPQYAKIL